MRPVIKKTVFLLTAVLLFAAVPFAMWYNKNYDKFGAIAEPKEIVLLQVCAINTGNFANTLRIKSSEYCNSNRNVKILILPLSPEQANGHDYNIKVLRENDIYYAFVSASQSEYEIQHCNNFLTKLKKIENIKLEIKT